MACVSRSSATSGLFLLLLTLPLAAAQDPAGDDFQQCDRDCRWAHGFFNRSITGVRVGALGNKNSWGRHCKCYAADGQQLGDPIERQFTKNFDSADYWCGNFSTDFVCALDETTGKWATTTRSQVPASARVLHCGKCSACSSPKDMQVLQDTRTFITTKMTKCSTAFAKPSWLGGHGDLAKLRACLVAENITFSNDRRFGDAETGPTCMDCWTDNIMCDSNACKLSCISKFIDPTNKGNFTGCLKCDESHCGPQFIRCAGANRRSSGIVSDIQRVGDQVCPIGWYWDCSQCHLKCKDQACHDKCDASNVCRLA
eukprot:g2877.t1